MAILTLLPDPAMLVKGVGAFGLFLSPIYFTLNLWAVTRLIDAPELRPSRAMIALAIIGILSMIAIAVFLLWTLFGSL